MDGFPDRVLSSRSAQISQIEIRGLRYLCFAGGVLLILCGMWPSRAPGQEPARPATSFAAFTAPASWQRVKHPSGVMLAHPRGWQLQVDAETGQVRMEGTGAQKLLVWPIFLRGPVSTELSSRILTKLAKQVSPEIPWAEPQQVDGSVVRIIHTGEREAIAGLAWTPSRSGSAGVFYLATTPPGDYRRNERTFAGILKSFQISGPDSCSEKLTPTLDFVRWEDPHEKAFHVEVPRDWQITGGLKRVAATDSRYEVSASSPDGAVRVYVGDADVPRHTLPTEVLELAGFHEGSTYSPSPGVTFQVQSYLPGADFALHYVANHVAAACSDVKYETIRTRDDARQGIHAACKRHLKRGMTRVDAGDVVYACRVGEQPKSGYAFAGTILDQQEVGGTWSADWNYGYLADPDRAAEAEYVLKQMIATFELDADWARRQSHLSPTAASLMAEAGNHVAALINDTYASRQLTVDDVFRRYNHAILEVDGVIGPDGAVYQVQSGNDFYWIDPRGNIIGTETSMRATVDFQALLRLP